MWWGRAAASMSFPAFAPRSAMGARDVEITWPFVMPHKVKKKPDFMFLVRVPYFLFCFLLFL